MRYVFDIEERYVRRVAVSAATLEEARAKVNGAYNREEVALTDEDLEQIMIVPIEGAQPRTIDQTIES